MSICECKLHGSGRSVHGNAVGVSPTPRFHITGTHHTTPTHPHSTPHRASCRHLVLQELAAHLLTEFWDRKAMDGSQQQRQRRTQKFPHLDSRWYHPILGTNSAWWCGIDIVRDGKNVWSKWQGEWWLLEGPEPSYHSWDDQFHRWIRHGSEYCAGSPDRAALAAKEEAHPVLR